MPLNTEMIFRGILYAIKYRYNSRGSYMQLNTVIFLRGSYMPSNTAILFKEGSYILLKEVSMGNKRWFYMPSSMVAIFKKNSIKRFY